jgi:hypothetical protein
MDQVPHNEPVCWTPWCTIPRKFPRALRSNHRSKREAKYVAMVDCSTWPTHDSIHPTNAGISESKCARYGWNSLTKCSNKFGILSPLSHEDRKVTPDFVGLLLL